MVGYLVLLTVVGVLMGFWTQNVLKESLGYAVGVTLCFLTLVAFFALHARKIYFEIGKIELMLPPHLI